MLTLPNILTPSRILAVPILVFLLWPEPGRVDYAIAFGLYALMAVTDYFDGYLARAQGTVSKLGVFLDPIADKIMVAAVIVMLTANGNIANWHVIAGIVIASDDNAVRSQSRKPSCRACIAREMPSEHDRFAGLAFIFASSRRARIISFFCPRGVPSRG